MKAWIIQWMDIVDENLTSDLNNLSVGIFLDRHHVWRSLDPTLDIWSNFVKSIQPPFFLLHFFLLTRFRLPQF